MRGRGISVKSAPIKPKYSEMAPKVIVKNAASKRHIIIIVVDTLYSIVPIIPVIINIIRPKNTVNTYLLLMSPFALIGEA